MTTFDPGLFARSLMGGLAQGASVRQHEDSLALQLHEMAQRDAAVQRQQQQEEAARQAYLGQIDTLRPAPAQWMEPPPATGGEQGPPAPVLNPDWVQHQTWRQTIQGAPSHVLGQIAQDYQQVQRQQQVAEFNENLKQRRVQNLLDKIEGAKKMYGHDERTSPMIAAGKFVLRSLGYNMPLITERHVDPDRVRLLYHELGIEPPVDQGDAVAAQQGDVGAMSRLATSAGGRAVMSHLVPRPKAGTAPANPQLRAQQWQDLVGAIPAEHTDPAILGVIHEKFMRGEKIGDTLWTKALPGDRSGKGVSKALQVEYEDTLKQLTHAESDLRHAADYALDTAPLEAAVKDLSAKKDAALAAYTEYLRKHPGSSQPAPTAAQQPAQPVNLNGPATMDEIQAVDPNGLMTDEQVVQAIRERRKRKP